MRFTLTYAGRLPSSSDAKRKHGIRLAFHPQLRELWRTHPALSGPDQHRWVTASTTTKADDVSGKLLTNISGKEFVTLIHPWLRLYAELDILVLRPEPPGALITHSGDIDNQLKTLFDALRRPVDASEIPSSWAPANDEKPLHCLLDDDKLITRVNVETDRLLKPGVDAKDVEVAIRVTVKAFTATWGNIGLAG